MKTDLRELAENIVRSNGLIGLSPVIEKEIVHYEVLQSLSKHGLLDDLAFQGGTCLRLCYGSERYSEDLDFAAGDAFDDLDIDSFGKALESDLLKTYDVRVRVKAPAPLDDSGGVGMRRWTIIVDTAEERPDIPAQRIKLEIASVPSHTSTVRQVNLNYPGLPSSYGQTLVRCQEIEEIMADKLFSFAVTEGYVRHRDLWDIPWLATRPLFDIAAVPALFEMKHGDYRCDRPIADVVAAGRARAAATIDSSKFLEQMRRFLAPGAYGRTVASAEYREAMRAHVDGAYRDVARALGIEQEVEASRRKRATMTAAHAANPARASTMGKRI